jgi:hypothetical protein
MQTFEMSRASEAVDGRQRADIDASAGLSSRGSLRSVGQYNGSRDLMMRNEKSETKSIGDILCKQSLLPLVAHDRYKHSRTYFDPPHARTRTRTRTRTHTRKLFFTHHFFQTLPTHSFFWSGASSKRVDQKASSTIVRIC